MGRKVSPTTFKLISEKTLPIFEISANSFVNTHLAEILIRINNRPIRTLLDLGATKSVINGNLPFFGEFTSKNPISYSPLILQCADGNKLPTEGLLDLKVKLNSTYSSKINFIVSKHLSHSCILGTDFIDSLAYTKDDPIVYVNGHKLRRLMTTTKSLIIRANQKLILEPNCRDALMKIKNPLYGNTLSSFVYLEKYKGGLHHKQFAISDAIFPNSEFLEVLITNLNDGQLPIQKGNILGLLSPCDESQVFTLSVAPDTETEKINLETFQRNRKQLFDSNFTPEIELNLTNEQKSEIDKVLRKYKLAFSANSNDLGRIAYWRYSIPFYDENSECYQPPRPIPPGLYDKVQSEFKTWKANDLVEEAYSPVNIPVLIVRKSNGDVRLALDARKLNSLSIKDRFPMPNIASIFYTIGTTLTKSKDPYISSFDAKRAYNQLLLAEKDRNKVAFSLFNRHYRAKRLVYGFQNGPAAFCRLMTYLFQDDPEIYCFIDDIIIVSANWENHKKAISRLLEKCTKIGLVLDPKKSQIGREEVTFLGETLTKKGRKPSDKHIKAILEYPVPVNRKELRRFNGLCVFEQKFIENSTIILEPLHKLAGAKADFNWTEKHQNAFLAIKQALQDSHGITHRCEKFPLVLTTDASLTMAAGILSQINLDGDYEPLGYFSRVFTPAEQRQSSRHREAYAIHDSVKHFQFQLLGQTFEIETDHHSLIWLAKENLSQTLTSRMINVYQYLAQFDFSIKYRPNTYRSIIAADALSRVNEQTLVQNHQHEKVDDPSIKLSGMDQLTRMVTQTNQINQVFIAEHFQVNALTRAAARKQTQEITTNVSPPKTFEYTKEIDQSFFRFSGKTFTYAEFLDLQRKDEFISRMKILLNCICKRGPKSKKRKTCLSCRKSRNFIIHNDLLYQKSFFKNRLVLPEAISEEFVNFLHVSHLHPGAKALERIIRPNLFIRNLQYKCKDICKRCISCRIVKPYPKPDPTMIKRKPAATYPFEYASMDLIDHGKPDSKGFRYLVVLNDQLTDFIDGEPLRNKSDRQVSKAINTLLLRHGAFSNIITDNGAEFGPLLKTFTKKLNINHIHISPYNSRGNRVERSNRDIRLKERLFNLSEKTWSEAWPLIRFHLNHSPKDKLNGLTPFEAAYGRSIYLPYSCDTEMLTTSDSWTKVNAKYFADLYPELVNYQNKRITDRNEAEKSFDLPLNSQVLIFKPSLNQSGKIGRFWDGPLTVTRKLSDHSYQLKCNQTKKFFRRHRRHIRPLNTKPLNPPPTNHNFSESDQDISKGEKSIFLELPFHQDETN